MTEPLALHPVSFSVRLTPPTKTIIARIWLVLTVIAVFILALPELGQFGTHLSAHRNYYRYYHLTAIEYDSKIKLFAGSADIQDVESFVEGDDSDAYTFLGDIRIGKHPHAHFGLFTPWMTSVGVSQIRLNNNRYTQTRLTQYELAQLVLAEASLNLNSPNPFVEFERMQSTGFLKLIANNPTPIIKFHPANIATDLLILIFIAGALTSTAYLIKRRIRTAKADETARCSTCGYPRTGLTSITQCPECGHHFKIRTSDGSV